MGPVLGYFFTHTHFYQNLVFLIEKPGTSAMKRQPIRSLFVVESPSKLPKLLSFVRVFQLQKPPPHHTLGPPACVRPGDLHPLAASHAGGPGRPWRPWPWRRCSAWVGEGVSALWCFGGRWAAFRWLGCFKVISGLL